MLLSVLLAGCADIAPRQNEAASSSAVRICHDQISLAGRFSAKYQKMGRDEAVHGRFEWVQSGRDSSLTLLSPLGQTIATINVTPTAATLTPAGAPPRTAADVDALTASSLGWALPVSGLGGWLQGCVYEANGRRMIANSASGSINTPDGWSVVYPLWHDENGGEIRPKRIDLYRADNGAAEISLRIVIDTWQPVSK